MMFIFQLKLFMLVDLSQPKLFTEVCQLVKLLQLGQQELKLDNFFYFAFLDITLGGTLFHFTFKKTFKPSSKIPLLVLKCNPHDSIYTIIFLFVRKVGCQQTEHWF